MINGIWRFSTKFGVSNHDCENRDDFLKEFRQQEKSQNMSEKPVHSNLSALFKEKKTQGEKRPASEMAASPADNNDTEGGYGIVSIFILLHNLLSSRNT